MNGFRLNGICDVVVSSFNKRAVFCAYFFVQNDKKKCFWFAIHVKMCAQVNGNQIKFTGNEFEILLIPGI